MPGTACEDRSEVRCLLVGVRAHGGEEVYSKILRDRPPRRVRVSATLDFHKSCEWGRCRAWSEILLNRLVVPWVRFNLGFRVLDVDPSVDLVHVHSHPTVLRGLRDRPVVFSAGSSHYHYLRDYEKWNEARIRAIYARGRQVYRCVGAVDALLNYKRITVAYTFSEWARKVYLDFGVPAEKIRVLYPGFDIPEPVRRPDDGRIVYLFMGRQPRRKGGDVVLEVFRELRRALPGARLLYVTDELPTSDLEGVDVRPLVSASEVSAMYRQADIFVNPTRAEGFGFTNVEAQGHGLPVISTRLGAIPEVVEDGQTGFLVTPGDSRGLSLAMRRVSR
jgi:glycosyltransferase involved in cell wall biosynthesis